MNAGQPKWFLQLKGHVQGPFNNENLVQAMQGLGEDNLPEALVWKRGLSEWIRATQWQKADQQISQQSKAENNKPGQPSTSMKSSASKPASTQSPSATAPTPLPKEKPKANPPPETAVTQINPNQTQATVMQPNTQVTRMYEDDEHTKTAIDNELFEKTFAHAFSDGVFYRVQVNFVDQPLMSKNELVQLIAKQEDISSISIQDPKTKEWKEIYNYPDLVEKLGISRRKSQRVPILAQFNGRSSKSKSVSYRVITISEGGMGFTENFDLKIGDEVEGQISSPHFFQPLSVKAEVIYAGMDGYIGLKFANPTDETKAAIIEYIKKFGNKGSKT